MSNSPEGMSLLPSPECTLPTEEQVITAVSTMHARLFDAALRPMLRPNETLAQSSRAEWAIETNGMTLIVDQVGGRFEVPPTFESLKTTFFTVSVRAGEGTDHRAASLGAVWRDGELILAAKTRYEEVANEPRSDKCRHRRSPCILGW